MDWRRQARTAFASALADAWSMAPARVRAAATILAFHRVRRDGERCLDPSLQITPEYLDAIVRFALSRNYDIVSMDTLHSRLSRRELARPMVAITFDDGYRDNALLAAPVLAKHGVPWTLYLATGFADRSCDYWWGALEQAVRERDEIEIDLPGLQCRFETISLAQKRAAIAGIARHARLHSTALSAQLAQRYGVSGADLLDGEALSWREVCELARDPNVTIGGHTISHRAMTTLTPAEAWQEISGCRERIEQMTGCEVAHFAPPHGTPDTWAPEHGMMARDAGYLTMTTTQPLSIFASDRPDMYGLPRFNVPGNQESLGHIGCKLAGLTTLLMKARAGTPKPRDERSARINRGTESGRSVLARGRSH